MDKKNSASQQATRFYPRFTFLFWGLIAFLFSVPVTSRATNHQIRMDTLMAGLNGDPSIQFLQISVNGNSQKDWGPQAGETQSRAMLVFFDAAGTQIGEFKFPSDPPNGLNTVLIATPAFTNLTGLRADVVIPALINPGSGKVCFKKNPANPLGFSVNVCLSYGSFPPALTEGAGTPAPELLITGDPKGLVRFQNFSFGDTTSRNADFRIGFPSPTNTSGQTFNFSVPGPKIQVARLIDFGTQNITAGATTPTTITIGNAGFSNALSLSSLTLIGTNANQFRILSDSGQSVLGPAASRTLTMDFDPSSLGTKNATLRILCNDTNEQVVDIALQGNGTDFNPCAVQNPTNAIAKDFSADAQLVAPGIVYTGTTVGATRDGSANCGNSTNSVDVWYKYAPSVNGTLTVSLQGSSFDTVLSAHGAAPGGTNNQIVCNDNFIGTQSQISFNVTNGVEVFLRIAGFNGATGAVRMTLTGPSVFNFDKNTNGINDNCEIDFGDAPAPYPTLLASNGARHKAISPFLGKKIDAETDGQPTALATGDNLNGPPNDDDGVIFTSALRPNQATTLNVVASAVGFLNAWIDFNSDGDWADAGEQIFINRTLGTGTNFTSFFVPNTAVVTNRTFARFRFNSTSGLSFTGLANDGEVEDYLVEISQNPIVPSPVGVRINEVMAGFNGDSAIQFVELEVNNVTNKLWGPQAGETVGRAMLVFSDAAGEQIGRFVFPSNAPSGGSSGNTVLIATRAFADLTGLQPDFVMPPELMPVAGKVSFRNNPDNSQFNINLSLAYGGSGYFGLTDGAGPPNVNRLPILDAKSLRRTLDFGFGQNQNVGFTLGVPTPLNTANRTFVFPAAASLAQQGKNLFTKETFRGNGRTCASCHVEGNDQFGLTPATIATLSEEDPLFIFESNVNQIRLTGRSQPSDLRGVLTGTNGSAKILSGSGDTYLVIGGTNLSGILTDTNGNTATFLSFTNGNLKGPTASNGSVRGLEDHNFLEEGRGLILENIDGFNKPEVFRASPHLLNLASTAPYGLSGEFANLRDFSEGAVTQHFPRNLARINGLDFRPPTAEELAALEAFQNTIGVPAVANPSRFDLDLLATTEAQKRGRELFFSDQSKCSKCHSGPTLSQANGSLPGSITGRNENFNTGVANTLMNMPLGDNLPTEPAGLPPGQSTRKFNTPPLFGIKLTAPYFHDASALNLTKVVQFYDSVEFVGSPDGINVGAVQAANDPAKVADLVAFLESLVEIPVNFSRNLSFDVFCAGETPEILTAVITNIGTATLSITNFVIAGTNSSEFQLISANSPTNLAPGATHSIQVASNPQTLGHKQATLEITANAGGALGKFTFGVALVGAFMDNVATIGPSALNFGTRDIDNLSGVQTQSVTIVSSGTLDLEIQKVSLVGNDAGHFQIVSNASPGNIPAGNTSVVQVVFAPTSRGVKSAKLRIESLACSNPVVEVALNGTATSTVTQFGWGQISSPQAASVAFPVRLSALDRNADTVTEFTGTADLLAAVNVSVPSSILISEIDPGTPDAVEFVNVSSQPVNLLNWRVTIFDDINFPNPLTTFTITVNSNLPAGGIFRLTEGGTAPGTFPNFFLGNNIFWTGESTTLAVLLRDGQSNIVDFATTGSSLSITNPVTIPIGHWNSSGISNLVTDDVTSHQRVGTKDRNGSIDWVVASRNIGTSNPGLTLPFPTNRIISFSPNISGNFSNGVWNGAVTVFEEAAQVQLSANDGTHRGSANLFNVIGNVPTISDLPNLTIDEDNSTATIPFVIADVEVPANDLIVSATSSNTNLVSNANIIFGGADGNRTIRIIPATNGFGATTITVSVTDGVSTNSDSFILTVNPVNDAPIVASIFNQTISEQILTSFFVNVTDVDGADTMTFTMETAPPGAVLFSTGVFAWTPTEAQGPSTNLFSIVVADNGTPSLSATQNFTITVLDANVSPALTAVSNRTIYTENFFSVTNFATDADIPTNTLSFSLVSPPVGAVINSSNGVFTWTPTTNQTGNSTIQVRVTDNGVPALNATQPFTLTVVKPAVNFTRSLAFGSLCVGNQLTNTISATFTNIGTNTVTFAIPVIIGTNASEFSIVSGAIQTNLAPGQVHRLELGFAPQTPGSKQAALELLGNENGGLGDFKLSVSLSGILIDNIVNLNTNALNFGSQAIENLSLTTNSIFITNNGSANLQVLSVALIGTNASDFRLAGGTGQTNLPPNGVRTVQIAFAPARQGTKLAQLRIQSLACSGATQDVSLAGIATSSVDHFTWSPIGTTQSLNVAFATQITAQDRNGETVLSHTGAVNLSSGSSGASAGAVPVQLSPVSQTSLRAGNTSIL